MFLMTTPKDIFPETPEDGKAAGFGESAPKGPIRYMDNETFESAKKNVFAHFKETLKKLAE